MIHFLLGRLLPLTLALFAAIFFHTVVAHADKSASPQAVDEARKRMEKGQSLFAQGRYQEAMVEFEEAWKAQPYGAFLYNAALAAEKSGDKARAIARYNEFIASDPDSPYSEQIRKKVKELEEQMAKVPAPAPEKPKSKEPQPTAPVPADEATLAEVRSLVLVESQPVGAPLSIYERVVATAAPFRHDGDNPGWKKIVTGERTPKDLSLKVGYYHVVIEPFQDFKRSETDINLAAGHVYTFKANLSQGEFMAFLRVKSNVEGAKVYLDDPPPHKSAPWTRTPKGGLVNQGEHELWVVAPGYKTFHTKVSAKHGETVELEARLQRVNYGYLVISGNAGEIEIEINNKPYASYLGRGDPVKVKLPAGKHSIWLDADGRKAFEGDIEVPHGQTQPVKARLMDIYSRDKAVVFGILSAGAGIGGLVMHLEHDNTSKYDPSIIDLFTYGRWALWGLSVAFGGLSIFFGIYDPYPESVVKLDKPRDFREGDDDATVKSGYIAPWFGPGSGGAAAGFRF